MYTRGILILRLEILALSATFLGVLEAIVPYYQSQNVFPICRKARNSLYLHIGTSITNHLQYCKNYEETKTYTHVNLLSGDNDVSFQHSC